MQRIFFNGACYAVFVIGSSNIIGCFFYLGLCIGHGYAKTDFPEKMDIVVTVSSCHNGFPWDSQHFAKSNKNGSFVDTGGVDLNIVA